MDNTPRGFRLHLGIFGRRNVGKSSLLNALTRQKTSIVSDIAGTTTDPIEKSMELLPIGPVLFIDTAGIDDQGSLGQLRIQKTLQVFDRTDIGLLVVDVSRGNQSNEEIWGEFENQIVHELTERKTPLLIVLNKVDLAPVPEDLIQKLQLWHLPFVKTTTKETSNSSGFLENGIIDIREALVRMVPEEYLTPPPIVSDLLDPNELAILVVPIDKEAPKGRLILPQVQTIRDILDGDQACLVVKENLLADVLKRCNPAPKLVITDSQAFHEVAKIVPDSIPLTSFSILFARQKGNLTTMVAGARTLSSLKSKSRVLIAESCSHHPIADDIGTEKIPRWLRKFVDDSLTIAHVQGHDFPTTPSELAQWDLIIHCGACMGNRREMLQRIARCVEAGVPITNYGLAIAFLNGILDRALQPFIQKNLH